MRLSVCTLRTPKQAAAPRSSPARVALYTETSPWALSPHERSTGNMDGQWAHALLGSYLGLMVLAVAWLHRDLLLAAAAEIGLQTPAGPASMF